MPLERFTANMTNECGYFVRQTYSDIYSDSIHVMVEAFSELVNLL